MGVKKAAELKEPVGLDELINDVVMIRPHKFKLDEETGKVDMGKYGRETIITDVEVLSGEHKGLRMDGKYISGAYLNARLADAIGTGDWVVGKIVVKGKGRDLRPATASETALAEARLEAMGAGGDSPKEVGADDEPPF